MATKKTTKKSSSSSSSRTGWGLNKISFWTIVGVTILYIVSLIFTAIGASKFATVIGILQGIATAIMIIIVSVLAWRYVRNKQIVWKILYLICLLIVIVGIILPLAL